MSKLEINEIKRRMSRQKPLDAEDLLVKCRFTLKHIGGGCFREVYKIVGTPYVVKVPGSRQSDLKHARQEFRAWWRIRNSRKYSRIRRYLPDILHWSYRSGMIVMPLYGWVSWAKYKDKLEEIRQVAAEVTGHSDNDLGEDKKDNYGLDEDGNIKIIDIAWLYGSKA